MVLMRKGEATKYVPDCFIESYRKNGYIVDGEEATVVAPSEDVVTDDGKDVSDAEEFACPHCGKEYKTAANLEKHIAKEHAE